MREIEEKEMALQLIHPVIATSALTVAGIIGGLWLQPIAKNEDNMAKYNKYIHNQVMEYMNENNIIYKQPAMQNNEESIQKLANELANIPQEKNAMVAYIDQVHQVLNEQDFNIFLKYLSNTLDYGAVNYSDYLNKYYIDHTNFSSTKVQKQLHNDINTDKSKAGKEELQSFNNWVEPLTTSDDNMKKIADYIVKVQQQRALDGKSNTTAAYIKILQSKLNQQDFITLFNALNDQYDYGAETLDNYYQNYYTQSIDKCDKEDLMAKDISNAKNIIYNNQLKLVKQK